MKIICAWHPVYFGVPLVLQEGTGEVSHGICHTCQKLLLEGKKSNDNNLHTVVTYGTLQNGDPNMRTALQKLKDLWAEGQYRKALKLAASWPKLGEQSNCIRTAWLATSNPRFYSEIGKDPVTAYEAGLVAVAERYGLPAPLKMKSVLIDKETL